MPEKQLVGVVRVDGRDVYLFTDGTVSCEDLVLQDYVSWELERYKKTWSMSDGAFLQSFLGKIARKLNGELRDVLPVKTIPGMIY